MTEPADTGSLLRRLTELTTAAAQAADPVERAAAFAEAHRVTAYGLRSAVAQGREAGRSWRDLAKALGVPVSTLHRQYGAATARAGQAPGVPAVDAPSAGGVPAVLDTFVGREQELAELPRLLWRRRTVTLTGPAGVGKTRLAVEIVHRVAAAYPGGVWWVDLTLVSRASLVNAAVSAAVGPMHVWRDARHVVAKAAAAGPVLLVLDNCEHLLSGVAALTGELLAVAPALRVLATSREALRAPGEAIVPVAPLTAGTDAARLFADRAQDLRPDLDTDAWAGTIAEICARLDGLPLAIEFAARQSDLLAPDRLLRELAERLELLAERGTRARHGSLRGAIQWSYDLLDDVAKTVFARLCLLPGGFDEHTAAAVTRDLGLSRAELWAVLTDLTRKSMAVPVAPGSGRFRILETLRAFGREVLDDPAARTRLLDWFTGYERQLAAHVWGDALTAVLSQMRIEVDNLRHAVAGAVERDLPQTPKLLLLLGRLLTIDESAAEARGLLAGVLTDPHATAADRAVAESLIATNAARLGERDTAAVHAGRALDLAEGLGDPDTLTAAVCGLMVAYGLGGRGAEGISAGAALLDRLRPDGNPGALGRILTLQAWLLADGGDIEAAAAAQSEAMALHEAHSARTASLAERYANDWATSMLQTSAVIALARGDDRTAAMHTTALLENRFEHYNTVVGALACAAVLAVRRGEHERALRLAAGANHLMAARVPYLEDRLEPVRDAAARAAGAARARAAVAAGRAMTMAQLKAYALDGTVPAGAARPEALTPREFGVAMEVARGHTNAQIAARLSISERTVASHLRSIRAKLGVHSRVGVALWASEASRSGDFALGLS